MNRPLNLLTLVFFVAIATAIAAGEIPGLQNPPGPLDQFKQRYGFEPAISTASQSPAAPNPDDIYWDVTISPTLQGVDGTITCAVEFNGMLVVAGDFSVAGNVFANNIAAWNGTSWSALGDGFNHGVTALAVYGNTLVASGNFTGSGNSSLNHIASWNGSNWSSLGSGLASSATALIEYHGRLIVSGDFAGNSIGEVEAWNGTSWSSLGSGRWTAQFDDAVVRTMAVYGGKLYVGGTFDTADSHPANNIAVWNDTVWTTLGAGFDGQVTSLTVYNSTLVAVGAFETANGVPAMSVAGYNGSTWSPFGSGLNSFPILVASFDGSLIAFGYYIGVQKWNGTSWITIAPSTGTSISTVCVYNNQLIGGVTAGFSRLVQWNGTGWEPLGSGTSGGSAFITSYALYNDKLIAAGFFTYVGGISANFVAQWDGHAWSSLGSGMNNIVYALAVYDNKLVASGRFDTAGGIPARYVAAWDGNSWSPLGNGMSDSNELLPAGYALQMFGDNLIMGGDADFDNTTDSNMVFSWNGSNWTSLGHFTPVYYDSYARIDAMTVYNGKLIAGGYFAKAGGATAVNVAAWDGSQWSAVGAGNPGEVHALTNYDGQLVAAGTGSIRRWNGSNWATIGIVTFGSGTGWPLSLTVYNNLLIAGGAFDFTNGIGTNGICAWNGSIWTPLGSGVGGKYAQVNALAEYQSALVAGGTFSVAGNKVACLTATWLKSPTDVNDGGHNLLPGSFALEQNYPNPFNPSTQIQFTLPARSHVSIEIFNLLGQSVRLLVDDTRSAGTYSTGWDGKDDTGKSLATGVYLYRLQTGDFTETRKMILLK
ncbi:MAG: T9SS type A sorting domain-containing protein [Candidatus Zixiibacteriota bacterium]